MVNNNLKNRIFQVFYGSDGILSASAVLFAFLTATLLLLVIGRNPSGMYQAMLQAVTGFDPRRGTWNARYIGEWLVVSIPLILCALSMGFAVRSGLFNFGAEGQYIAGLTAAQVAAVLFPPVPFLHTFIAVIAAVIAGAVWGSIAGFLKARYKVSEIVSTIMLNYIAFYLHRFVMLRIPGSTAFRTSDFTVTASLSNSFLSSLTNGSRLNNGLWLMAAAVLIYWVIFEKTNLGNSLKITDADKNASLKTTVSMLIAGAFAGLAGAVVSLGMFNYGRILVSFDNYGFEGIVAALAGNCGAIGIAVMGFFFGMLKSAQPLMQSRQIPAEIAAVIMGLVVVFLSLLAWRNKKPL